MADAAAAAASRRPVAVEALRITLGRPPVWLLVWALELVLALFPALLFARWFQDATAHRYAPQSLFADLGADFRFDHRQGMSALDASIGSAGALLVLVAMLGGAFFAGGWLQVFLERTHGHSLQRFFFGGARYFWRFVRVLALTVLSLALLSWLLFGMPWNRLVLGWGFDVPEHAWTSLETLSSERTARSLQTAQQVLFALGYTLVLVWGDYVRTRIALHDTSSAVWAGLCGWFTLLRHPLRTLRPYALLFALELAIVLAVGWFARVVEAGIHAEPDPIDVLILFGAAQLVLLWRVVLRGARYHACVQVSREVVRPIARPDPWKASAGGPGGPRYPIGGEEYGI